MQISPPQVAYQLAEQFAAQQLTPHKGRSVYLNTLAVHAVARYLKLFNVEVDLNQGDWQDPINQVFQDSTDLVILGKGRVECRPVLPGTSRMILPNCVSEDVIGYIGVQFSDNLQLVDLLGFFPSNQLEMDQQTIDISEILPLETIFSYLDPVTRLAQVFQGRLCNLWQRLDSYSQDFTNFLRESFTFSQSPAFSMRSRNRNESPLSEGAIAKTLPLGNNLVLIIDRTLSSNATSEEEVSVSVIICSDGQTYSLPPDLQLTISDGTNTQVTPVTPGIPLLIEHFDGTEGESFQISITSNGAEYSESFEV